MIAVPTRHRLGNAPTGRAASVRWMMYIVAFTGNQIINQRVNMFHCRRVLTFATIITNMVICRKVKNAKPQRWRVAGIFDEYFLE
jgi:hypothetical protein